MNVGSESETVEFKKGIAQLSKGIEGLSAMLNKHNTGTLYLGVDDNGDVVGIDVGRDTLEKIRNEIDTELEPKCIPEIDVLHTEDGLDYVRIVCTGYEPAYSFKGRYYIRNVTSDVSLTPPLLTRMLLSKGTDPPKQIVFPVQDLTFSAFTRYLESVKVHVRADNGFYESHGMKTSEGKFNLLAYLMSDQNDVPMQVIVFDGKNKSVLSHRKDFGRISMMISVGSVLDNIRSYQDTKVLSMTGRREEVDLFGMDAFREAWINACVHNDWKNMIPPSVFLFDDRIEVQSYGSIPFMLSEEEFYSGKSMPVNKTLFDLFHLAGYAEQCGRGISTIVEKYGRDAICRGDNIFTVTIPFAYVPDHVKSRSSSSKESLLNRTDRMVRDHLKENPHAKIREISEHSGLSVPAINKVVKKLKDLGFLTNEGNNRINDWNVKY